jgi:hypothetical protein
MIVLLLVEPRVDRVFEGSIPGGHEEVLALTCRVVSVHCPIINILRPSNYSTTGSILFPSLHLVLYSSNRCLATHPAHPNAANSSKPQVYSHSLVLQLRGPRPSSMVAHPFGLERRCAR